MVPTEKEAMNWLKRFWHRMRFGGDDTVVVETDGLRITVSVYFPDYSHQVVKSFHVREHDEALIFAQDLAFLWNATCVDGTKSK